MLPHHTVNTVNAEAHTGTAQLNAGIANMPVGTGCLRAKV